jgi:hypothetical protein
MIAWLKREQLSASKNSGQGLGPGSATAGPQLVADDESTPKHDGIKRGREK